MPASALSRVPSVDHGRPWLSPSMYITVNATAPISSTRKVTSMGSIFFDALAAKKSDTPHEKAAVRPASRAVTVTDCTILFGPHPIVSRVVLHLGRAQRLQQRRHIHT